MSHWFDRLAAWSADDGTGDEELRLTRRQAVRAAAGVGAVGVLGGPLAGKALAIAGGNSAQCQCWDKANRINDAANRSLINKLGVAAVVSPAVGVVLTVGLLSTSAAFLGQVVHCGLCKDDPPLQPPPPNLQPCTQRGGARLVLADQCGGGSEGGGGAEVGSGCGPGTSSCPTPGGGDLCCFGSDICCSGCCCIAEVGCGCCG
jgi:hypothetical protein